MSGDLSPDTPTPRPVTLGSQENASTATQDGGTGASGSVVERVLAEHQRPGAGSAFLPQRCSCGWGGTWDRLEWPRHIGEQVEAAVRAEYAGNPVALDNSLGHLRLETFEQRLDALTSRLDAIEKAPSVAATGLNGQGDGPGEGVESGREAQDPISHPAHYTAHPSGIECIQITEHMNFNLGNAIKYLWRAGIKSTDPTEDLRKAAWYVQRELARIEEAS